MSASAWTRCPKCNATNPDSEGPGDYCYGTVRVDHEFATDTFNFRVRFWCVDCDWSHEFTEKDIP